MAIRIINWFRDYICFLRQLPSNKRRAISFVRLLNILYIFPCYMFHEACHLIIIKIFRIRVTKILFVFLKIHKNKTRVALIRFSMRISHRNNYTAALCAVAPLPGAIALMYLCYSFNMYLTLIYLISCFKYLRLSKTDIKTIKNCYGREIQFNRTIKELGLKRFT